MINTNITAPTKKSSLISPLLKSYFSTLAITRIGTIHAMNIIAFFLFILISCFYIRNQNYHPTVCRKDKQASLKIKLFYKLNAHTSLTDFFSFFLSCSYLSGSYHSITSDISNGLFKGILLFSTFIGLYCLLKEILFFLSSFLFNKTKNSSYNTIYNPTFYLSLNKVNTILKTHSKKIPFLCFLLCILVRIPFFLYSYPGIMTPDSINQVEQILGMQPFSNHHPWVHTMIMSFFYHLGSLFTENRNLAFAFYTIFQLIFMAFAASYLIFVLDKYVKYKVLLLLVIFFYAFLPYHSVMAICIWKDVMFSGTVLLFSTTLFHLLMIQKRTTSEKPEINLKDNLATLMIYFVSGVLFCLLRSNGRYAFFITFPFLLYSFWKSKKLMYPLHLLILLLVLFIKGPVMDHYQVKQPDFVESLSIPLQQVGRVIAKNHVLTQEEWELLNNIMDTRYVGQLYTEFISDPMKELVRAGNPSYLTEHKVEYLKLWIRLGLRYPATYLEAWLEQTKGFYSPSTVYSVAEVDGIIDNDTGLSREYLLRGKGIVKIREILIKLQEIFPIYGALWSMGSLFWGILILLYLQLSKRYYLSSESKASSEDYDISFNSLPTIQIVTLWLPSIAIIGTLLLATPVATEFRYAYHLAYCLPLYLGIVWSKCNHSG